jgi:Icc-related predicted phosphoesterase
MTKKVISAKSPKPCKAPSKKIKKGSSKASAQEERLRILLVSDAHEKWDMLDLLLK